jgi:hypothetical protein
MRPLLATGVAALVVAPATRARTPPAPSPDAVKNALQIGRSATTFAIRRSAGTFTTIS